jgi:hypothetical protein
MDHSLEVFPSQEGNIRNMAIFEHLIELFSYSNVLVILLLNRDVQTGTDRHKTRLINKL